MDFNTVPTQEVENELILESLPVVEISNDSWFLEDGWFKSHPEKVLGEAYETSGRFGKVTKYKGTIDSVERIDVSIATPQFNLGGNKPLQTEGTAYVQSVELMNPVNQDFVLKAIENSHKNAGKKAIDKKNKATVEGDDIVFKDVELQTFSDVYRTYNQGISADELEVYVWYKSQIGKPLSRQWVNLVEPNRYTDNLNETVEFNRDIYTISKWVEQGLLFYYEDKLVPAVEYLSGNMYDKKMQLDRDKDQIIAKYSEDVYNNQVEAFNTSWRSVYDKRLTIGQSEDSLVILPISKLASEFKISRLASFADDKGFKLIMVTASSNKYFGNPDWAKDATKSEYDRDRKDIESLSLLESFNYFLLKIRPELKLPITHLDIVNYYCYGKNITGGTKNMDEKEYKSAEAKKEKLKSNTQIEGERLFKIFLDTELEPNDKIRLETEWNSNYNNFKQIDLNKVPVAFNMCRKYKGTFEKLLPEKREAVAFTMHTGSGIISYDVGVGKTPSAIFTMSAFIDAGYAKRICLTVPNQVYKQFISEIRSFAPHIPIIEGYNLSPDYLPNFQNSKGEMENVPSGSITVLTYEGLERVGFNETTQNEMISGLYEILNQGGESERVVSSKESAKKTASFYEKIETLVGKGLSGTTFNIEDFGFDFMCYDEAHKMKKVFTAVKGEVEDDGKGKQSRGRNPYQINSGVASNIALKGFMLNYYVQQKNKGGNVLMLTATPFTNSPLEIFSMLSMVGYDKLKDTNLNNIKTFFDTYVNCTTQLVINSRLKPQFKQVILGFNNLISLQTLIRRFINYKTGEEVKVPRPKKYVLPYVSENIDGVITRLSENEKVETFIPMTPLQEIMMDSIIAYVEDKGDIDTSNFSEDDLVEQENGDEIDVDSLVYYLTVDKNGKQGKSKGIVSEIISEGNETKYKVKKADKEWGELDPIKIAGTFKENELELFVDEGSVEVDIENLDSDEKAGVKIIKGLTYARNLALSPHLFELSGLKKPDYKSYIEMSPKLKYVMGCVKSVRDYHIKNNEPISGQVIYMDRGIKYFGLLKEYLIKECGFKEHEIGIIKSGLPKNGKRSKEYIKNLFNGEVYNEVSKLFDTVPDEDRIKVVIGSSTIKEGINLQKFGTVLYNCFIDWNPTDIQQLEGRIWRQGNEFKYVRIVNPLVIDSADIFIFQKLQEKTSRLNTIWATDGKKNVLNTEEFNPEELKYALIRDPKVIAELKSIEEKAKLESSQLGFGRQLEQIEKLKQYSYKITSDFQYLLKSISPYRDVEITGDRLVDASNITKAIIETEKSQKDKEGKKLVSYSERRPEKQYYESWTEFEKRKLEIPNYSKLDKYNKPSSYFSDFALAVREVNKMVTNFVNQYELTFSLDNFAGLDDFKLNIEKNIEANKERQKYFESDEYKKQVEEEIVQERLQNQLEYKPLKQTIFDFGKLNYLLSEKKVSSKVAITYPSCPPMDANGVALIDKNAIAYLTQCIEKQGQTKDLYFNEATKTYTPERQALHDEIIGNLFKEVKCVKQGKPIAVFTGGSPASGKSYFITKIAPYLTNEDVFHLDADDIRSKLLPEYQGWNASVTHKETQDIVNQILETIGEGSCRYDFIYDGTMNKAEKYFPLINKVKALGYETYIIFLDIPYSVAFTRSLQRYQNGFKDGKMGRYVPIQVIDEFFTIRPNSGGKTMGQYALDQLKTMVDGYIVVDGLTGNIIDKKGDAFPRNRDYESKTVVPLIENSKKEQIVDNDIPKKVKEMFYTEPNEGNFSFIRFDKQMWRRDNRSGEITNQGDAPEFAFPKSIETPKVETKSEVVSDVKESFRTQFKNELGSFTSVFAFVNPKDKSNFTIETTVRRKNDDGTESIQTKSKEFPIDRWDSFIKDLKERSKNESKETKKPIRITNEGSNGSNESKPTKTESLTDAKVSEVEQGTKRYSEMSLNEFLADKKLTLTTKIAGTWFDLSEKSQKDFKGKEKKPLIVVKPYYYSQKVWDKYGVDFYKGLEFKHISDFEKWKKGDSVFLFNDLVQEAKNEYELGMKSVQKNEVEQPTEKREFNFMSNNPMQRGKSLETLNKSIRSGGVVMKLYEWIEKMPKGLTIDEEVKLGSSKAAKGYKIVKAIGDHIVDSKAEIEYYKYLSNGGYPYSEYLAVQKAKSDEEKRVKDAQYEIDNKKRIESAKKAKLQNLKFLLEHSLDEVVAKMTKGYLAEIENLKKQRQTEANKKDIQNFMMYVEQAEKQAKNNYFLANKVYELKNDEVVPKYQWNVGDKVLTVRQNAWSSPNIGDNLIETKIVETRVNVQDEITYKLEMVEGLDNAFVSYDSLFPLKDKLAEIEPQEPTTQDILDTIEGLQFLADDGDQDAIDTIEGLRLLL